VTALLLALPLDAEKPPGTALLKMERKKLRRPLFFAEKVLTGGGG
jgi:hypothetical protein